MFFLGLDLALNRSGSVLLGPDGRLLDWMYVSPVKRECVGRQGRYLALDNRQSRDIMRMWRLVRHRRLVLDFVQQYACDVLVGLEGYAVHAVGQVQEIAELSGMVKHDLFTLQIPFRLHDPMSLKLAGAEHGHAEKAEILALQQQRCPDDIALLVAGLPARVVADLVDAWVLARLVWREYEIRVGRMRLEDLYPGERRIFLRVTRTSPENILSVPWVSSCTA